MKSKLILCLILIAVVTLSHLISNFIFKKYIKKIIDKDINALSSGGKDER